MEENTLVRKETHTRFIFAMVAMAASFGYLFYIGREVNPTIVQAVFAFLGTVALGFGVAKATQHFKPKP